MQAGALAPNLLAFARLLRRAGLRVGTADALRAADALTHIDLGDRRQAHAALRATLVHRREEFETFDQAFLLFWRAPEAGRNAAAMAMEGSARADDRRPPPAARRVLEAVKPPRPATPPQAEGEAPPPLPVALSVSERERLQRMDFEAMSAVEIAAAKREIRRLTLPLDARPTRRFRPDAAGPRSDLRATLRASLRTGGEVTTLARRRRVTRPPPLVALCDISGSMARYAQLLVHFLHAVANDRDRVHTFLFGTRLSNVTRQLRHRDAEVAFELVGQAVPDWSGGTRIGESLAGFNRLWARRVLGQGAVVLLITDGLERASDPAELAALAAATDRLRRSCRRLIWLNPLLRWDGFEPRSGGNRAMLPHVDEFRPVHSLASLAELVAALSRPERADARPLAA